MPAPALGDALEPPRELSTAAKAEWRRLAAEFEALGLITVVDRGALAAYCSAYARFLQAETKLKRNGGVVTDRDGRQRRSPWLMVQRQAVEQMTTIGARFGMTPADRARLGVIPGTDAVRITTDPFERFIESNPRRLGQRGDFAEFLASRP